MKKKKIMLSFDKPFIAAYSRYPFENSGWGHPNYRFEDDGELHWAYYSGDLQIPWGVRANHFKAYGFLRVERLPKNWRALDRTGLHFRQSGDVFYLYQEEWDGSDYVGFLPFLSRTYVNPWIRALITDDMDADVFRAALDQPTYEIKCKILEMEREYSLRSKGFTIQNIIKEP